MGCTSAKLATQPIKLQDIASKYSNGEQAWTPREGEENEIADGLTAAVGSPLKGVKGAGVMLEEEMQCNEKLVMFKYLMSLEKEDVITTSISSTLRKGYVNNSNERVSIKVYNRSQNDVAMLKFQRQVAVLAELHQPFTPPADAALWHRSLASLKPANLYVRVLDHSKSSGRVDSEDADGDAYIVMEFGQCTLKDYLTFRREQELPLSEASLKFYTRSIIEIVSGIHAKGYVHLDIRPELFMTFNTGIKLFDVESCRRIGTCVSIQDATLAISACYCSPEWATFLASKSKKATTTVKPSLDAWSTGLTLCELATFEVVLGPMYESFKPYRHLGCRSNASFFMNWLSSMKDLPFPSNVTANNPQLADLVKDRLLHTDAGQRASCAQSLDHEHISNSSRKKPRAQSGVDTSRV